jgi:hypothetical protein
MVARMTTMVVLYTSLREGHVTFLTSALTSLKKGPSLLYHLTFLFISIPFYTESKFRLSMGGV